MNTTNTYMCVCGVCVYACMIYGYDKGNTSCYLIH